MSQTVILLSKMSAVGLSVKLLFCFVCLSDCRLQGQQFNEVFQTAHSPAASSSSKAIWYKAVVNYFENILYTQYSIHTERKLHLSKPRHAGVLRNYCHYTMHVVNLFWCCCLMQKFFQTHKNQWQPLSLRKLFIWSNLTCTDHLNSTEIQKIR